MMIRAALCYSLQPTFGQLQLSESLTKTFWYKYCPPWFKAMESYKSGPGKSRPLPWNILFSLTNPHENGISAFGFKDILPQTIAFPLASEMLQDSFFLFECVWFCGGLVFTPRCILNLFVLCQGGMCVCTMYVHAHTHTHEYSDGCSNCMSWYTCEGQRATLGLGPCLPPWLKEDLQ